MFPFLGIILFVISRPLFAIDLSQHPIANAGIGNRLVFRDRPDCSRHLVLEGSPSRSPLDKVTRFLFRGRYLPLLEVGEVIHGHHVDRSNGAPFTEWTQSRVVSDRTTFLKYRGVTELETVSTVSPRVLVHYKLKGSRFYYWDERNVSWSAVKLPEPEHGLSFSTFTEQHSPSYPTKTENTWFYVGRYQIRETKYKYVYVLHTEDKEKKLLILSYFSPRRGLFHKVVFDLNRIGTTETWGTYKQPNLTKAVYLSEFSRDRTWRD